MAHTIRRADYFNTTVRDAPGEAYDVLSRLAEFGINLMAFTAVPVGPTHTQFTIFPDDVRKLERHAERTGLSLDGPHPALLVLGDDELGALASVHVRLHEAKVNVYASSGVADGKGGFGYILYVKPEDYERAANVLGL